MAAGTEADPLLGTRGGRYVVRRKLARGGRGVVYEVEHESIGHRAAVKVLASGLAGDPRHANYVARFFDEARAVNFIRHPGVLKISDFGELPDGAVFLVMELLEGESLWDRMWRLREETGGTMGLAAALRTVGQIASAMAAAHRKRIVHRDLKPETVFVVEDPDMLGGERVKVLDFGIARFLDSPYRRTTLGIVLGTPTYMAPEQCECADELTEKVDVYSLGVMA